jgi:hypothetical protein
MLSIGLWRWYINITATILSIIQRPVLFYATESGKGIFKKFPFFK